MSCGESTRLKRKMSKKYDVIVIGGGPAGLTAGLYTARARLSSLLIERGLVGGQITNAERVNNYPGFAEGINGADLGQLISQQAETYGLETLITEVTGVELEKKHKVVKTTQGELVARVLIIASGSDRQKLGVPGEEEFTGRGVSYCATCDAAFFREQPIAIVGGGDAAVTEALHLTKFASRVILIHRRDQLRAGQLVQERVFSEPKMEFCWDSMVEKIEGEESVQKVRLRQVRTGKKSVLEVAGIFVSIGLKPNTGYLKGILPLDTTGHIITDETMATGVPGIFAAGDIRHNSARQAITAAGDGATAAIYAERFISA